MSEVHGECDDGFLPLRDLFQVNLDAAEELGASLAVVRSGVFLVTCGAGGLTPSAARRGCVTPSRPPGR